MRRLIPLILTGWFIWYCPPGESWYREWERYETKREAIDAHWRMRLETKNCDWAVGNRRWALYGTRAKFEGRL